MKTKRILVAIGLSLGAAVFAKDVDVSKIPPPSDRKNLTYEKDIKPIFEKSCVKCHGDQPKPKGKLRLNSLADTLKGGENGKVIEPGNSTKSVLVHSIAQVLDEDEWMPPPDNKEKIKPLNNQEIGLIRAWIDQGAK